MVDRSVEVRLRAEVANYKRGIADAASTTDRLNTSLGKADASSRRLGLTSRKTATDVDQVGESARRSGLEIDKLSDRVKLYMQAAVITGPGLLPVLATTAPAVAGLSTGLAAAALGGVSLIAALQGVADATKAVDAYRLDPTVESYEKARQALEDLSPAAQQFVMDFQQFQPVLTSLRDASAEGWMPGLSDALDNLTTMAPRGVELLRDVSKAGGDALADSTASLASDRWEDFYDLIERQAPDAITTLTDVVGNLSHGLAEMMVSGEDGSDRFMDWVDGVADGFDRWASSDKGREDVQAFLDYAATNGPQVQAFFGSVVDTVAQIVQAAAPLGGPVLTTLTAVSDVLGAIADSPVGTPLLAAAAGLSVFNRAAKITTGLGASTFITKRFPDGIKAAASEARAGTPRFRDFGNALAYAAHSNDTLTRAQKSGSKVAATSATNALRARAAVAEWSKGAARAAAPVAALGLVATGAADNMGVSNAAAGALIGTLGGPWGMAFGAAVGGVLDVNDALFDFDDRIASARAAMQAGDIDAMRSAMADLRVEIDDTSSAGGFFSDALQGLSLGKIDGLQAGKDQLDELQAAIRAASEVDVSGVGTAGNGLNLLTDGLDLTTRQFEEARLAGNRFFDMLGAASGVLDRRAAWRAYQDAIDGASEALKTNGKTLDNNVAAGRANNDALDSMSRTALTFADNLKGADRVDFLRGARNSIQQAAQDFGMGRAAARRLANDLIGLGNVKPKPKVDLDDGAFNRGVAGARGAMRNVGSLVAIPNIDVDSNAASAAGSAQAYINSVTNKVVYITTIHRSIDEARAGQAGIIGQRSTRRAEGGLVLGPGGPRDDLIPAMLSNREYVINAGAVEHYGLDVMNALNARRLAEGGPADRLLAKVRDYQHLAEGGKPGRRGGTQGGLLAPARGAQAPARGALDPISAEAMGMIREVVDRFAGALERNEKALKGARGEKRKDLLDKREEIYRDRLKASAEVIKRETDDRKTLIDSIKAYRSEVSGTYQADIFGNGLAGLQLAADTNDANTAYTALRGAASRGLNGPLFDALIKSGDVNTIGQVGALGARGLAGLESAFGARQAATDRIGSLATAVNPGFDAALARQNKLLASLERAVQGIGRQVHDGARDGSRKGSRDGSRDGTRSGVAEGNRQSDRVTTQTTRTRGRGGGRRGRG